MTDVGRKVFDLRSIAGGSRLAIGVACAMLLGMTCVGSPAAAKSKVVYDKTNGPYNAAKFDIKKVVVSQRGATMNFSIIFRGPRSRTAVAAVLIKAGGQEYMASRRGLVLYENGKRIGPAKYRGYRRKFKISFPLGAIGKPKSLQWLALASPTHIGELVDYVPEWPHYGFWKVQSIQPPKSGGPALRGPKTVKPGRSVKYLAYWFTPGTLLAVTVKSKSGKGKVEVGHTSFTARESGKSGLKFRFPKVNWTGKTRVTVCGLPPGKTVQECAGTTSLIPKPNLPVKVIPFGGGVGFLTFRCTLSSKCSGTAEIKRGKTALTRKRRYSVAAHSKERLKLRLTRAGRKALDKSRRVKGVGILTGRSGAKSMFVAILKRR